MVYRINITAVWLRHGSRRFFLWSPDLHMPIHWQKTMRCGSFSGQWSIAIQKETWCLWATLCIYHVKPLVQLLLCWPVQIEVWNTQTYTWFVTDNLNQDQSDVIFVAQCRAHPKGCAFKQPWWQRKCCGSDDSLSGHWCLFQTKVIHLVFQHICATAYVETCIWKI